MPNWNEPFTREEMEALPSRVMTHGKWDNSKPATDDANLVTLGWEDYSRLFETALRGLRSSPAPSQEGKP